LKATPLTKSMMLVRLDRSAFVAALSSGCSFENESMKNAVTIAENRPISKPLLGYFGIRKVRSGRTNTSIASNPPFHLSIVGPMVSA
jgi:hypothetical protein